MRARSTAFCAAVAAVTLLGTTISPAQAVEPETVTGRLVTPLSLAVSDDGSVYVAQNFAGMLTKVAPGGEKSTVYTDPDRSEVGAVSVAGDEVTFATTGGTRKRPKAHLWRVSGEEAPTKLANLYRYEKQVNPDAGQRYGLVARKSCQRKVPPFVNPYQGIIESHPYATALTDGATWVADAAGNDILAVTDAGVISTVAVLPVTRVKITRAMKREFELHKCVIGKTYRAEPVPTDVELGPDGNLYVTTLPGVPGEGLPVGKVYRITPEGDVSKAADGLVTPVGIAMTPEGNAYISQLFAGNILAWTPGEAPTVFAEVPFPGDVEVSDGWVYATETDLTNENPKRPRGKVLRWSTAPMSE